MSDILKETRVFQFITKVALMPEVKTVTLNYVHDGLVMVFLYEDGKTYELKIKEYKNV